jgi:tRNA G46 methylase TrmB
MHHRVKRAANRVAWRISGSKRVARTAAVVRNQCQTLIGYHLAPSSNAWENGEQWLVERVAPKVRTFLDVGANVGSWSQFMLAQNPDAQGIAVEPGTAALARLRQTLNERVEIVEAAMAMSTVRLSFRSFQTRASCHRLSISHPSLVHRLERYRS